MTIDDPPYAKLNVKCILRVHFPHKPPLFFGIGVVGYSIINGTEKNAITRIKMDGFY